MQLVGSGVVVKSADLECRESPSCVAGCRARGLRAIVATPMVRWARWQAAATLIVASLSLLAASGCGDPGPVRHRVQGTVTYGGKPVTFGRVVFDPDVMKDNRGPQGYAAIENGRFDTAANGGKGTSGGPMVLTLDGFEPIGDGLDATAVRPLFSGHQEHRDLPAEDVEIKIDIPAGAEAGP